MQFTVNFEGGNKAIVGHNDNNPHRPSAYQSGPVARAKCDFFMNTFSLSGT